MDEIDRMLSSAANDDVAGPIENVCVTQRGLSARRPADYAALQSALRARTIAVQICVVVAILFSICIRQSVAQEEVKLDKSINILPDHPSGIELIMKVWQNESDARSRFLIELFTKITKSGDRNPYYERVLSFANGKRVELANWEAPDCSLFQTVVFRRRSSRGYELFVVTAERLASTGTEIVPQSDPLPQKIRAFVLKDNAAGQLAGKSSHWLDSVAERVTDKSVCTADEVRAVISDFVLHSPVPLGSR